MGFHPLLGHIPHPANLALVDGNEIFEDNRDQSELSDLYV